MPKTTAEKEKFSLSLGRGKVGSTGASNFCKPGNSSTFSDQGTGKDLGIIHVKGMRKSSLPSLSTLLSSSSKDSELLPRIEKPQRQFKAQKYVENNADIFVSKDVKDSNRGREDGALSPIDSSGKKCNEYAISKMFSDGLSDKENIGEEFCYAADSWDSDIDILQGRRKEEEFSCGMNKQTEQGIQKTLGEIGIGTFYSRSNLLDTDQRSKKLLEGSSDRCKMNNLMIEDEKLKKRHPKATKTLLNNSMDEIRKPRVVENVELVEPFDLRKKGPALSPVKGIFKISNDRSAPDIFESDNPAYEVIESDGFESDSVQSSLNLTLSECNLSVMSSQDLPPGSIESLNKRVMLYINENNSGENRLGLTPENFLLFQSPGINSNTEDSLGPSDLLHDTEKFNKNYFVSEPKAWDNSEISSQSSDSLEEFSKIGSQLSGLRKISVHSSVEEFKLSPKYVINPKCKNPVVSGSRKTSFIISQSEYFKQRKPFLNRKKANDVMTWKFKLCNTVAKEIEQNRAEEQLPKVYNSYDCLKRRRPSEKNINFLNVEKHNTYNRSEKDKSAFVNPDKITRPWSNQFSTTQSKFSNLLNTNERSSQSGLSRTSYEVQSFVKEWLDKQDEIDSETAKSPVSKRSRLGKDREMFVEEENIDIDPKSLFSNYCCEYTEAYRTRRFAPEQGLLESNDASGY